MKRQLLSIGILFVSLLFTAAFSRAVTFTGDTFLKDQSDHTGIKVLFRF